ncbi:MAG: NYN domain-containing protein [Myxococcales bacterium]|nr:NYN domain-containing protein [Myxococcales bacterium]
MDERFAGQRVAVLVDTANLYQAARALHAGKPDYGRLLEVVGGGRPLVRAIAYVVRGEHVDMSGFLGALDAQGYELRVKTVRRDADGGARGDSRVALALDAVALAPRVDVVALVSGDGDFAALAAPVAAAGARLEVHAFEGSVGDELARAAHACRVFGAELLLGAA